jgi:hypothetical protein
VQRVERVENPYDKSGRHNHTHSELERFFEHHTLLSQVGLRHGSTHRGDQEAEQSDAGNG